VASPKICRFSRRTTWTRDRKVAGLPPLARYADVDDRLAKLGVKTTSDNENMRQEGISNAPRPSGRSCHIVIEDGRSRLLVLGSEKLSLSLAAQVICVTQCACLLISINVSIGAADE
jgi:hypothetical protein